MKDNLAFQVAALIACQRDPRFAIGAYSFLCDALAHSVKMLGREEEDRRHVHVNGPELLAGCRDLAVLEFGPLANFVMQEWGVQCSEHVGAMVFAFIEIGYFGKNETDRIEDFSDGVDMVSALRAPFIPKARSSSRSA
jgi:uncharacterized repeat protein (TIGR04138 family)